MVDNAQCEPCLDTGFTWQTILPFAIMLVLILVAVLAILKFWERFKMKYVLRVFFDTGRIIWTCVFVLPVSSCVLVT